ncbi:hypothetical protein [Ruminococcus albus]|uniref:Uncharacterized protein n=1 Tax=Ruminococcus albus (strain ATCC 27210 / DSM 20455 / JCM 14654 / NCDO 2250 / 7) TaxID=697329 RepID=E6UB92_RUMA7|nr:hypothetical protein [Ruminococcus albus]ADU21442.1 hypothetical protein Rumal_0916 [Ruminococcus albus 7 = DSM 20455]
MDSIIGIKADKFTAAVAKVIRAYEDVSMSEIKRRIADGDYIYSGDLYRAAEIKKVLKINDELTKAGINCEMYVHDEVTNTEYLNNLLVSYKQTEEWTEYVMDMEAQAEESSE